MDLSLPISNQIKHRVAILVDGDNVPYTNLPTLEANASKWGDVTIRRVFGDMTLHKSWAAQTNYAATHCTTSAGKNRADMALVVAAMDFAHRGLATAFVVASDDRDFGPLVSHLREQGYRVDWVGKSKAAVSAMVEKPAKATVGTSMLDRVRCIVAATGEAGFPIHSLGPAMQKEGIKVSDTPQKSWRVWLTANPSDFVCDKKGTEARVRLKS